MSVSSRAYKLFSEHKSPIEVAIALNIRQQEAVQFYKEYSHLSQLHDLYRVYEEIKDDLYSFVELYRLTKAARMGTPQVINLLKIANNDLPSVQHKFEQLLAYHEVHYILLDLHLTIPVRSATNHIFLDVHICQPCSNC